MKKGNMPVEQSNRKTTESTQQPQQLASTSEWLKSFSGWKPHSKRIQENAKLDINKHNKCWN